MRRTLPSLASFVTLVALLSACSGPSRSVRIAAHHPEFASAMACHDRCSVSFGQGSAHTDCFAGCPGVVTTSVPCDEPAAWNGVCYLARKGEPKSSSVGSFVGIAAAVIGVALLVGTVEGIKKSESESR